ncbi:MAG: hypothetical protein AAF296_00465 [Pseudomonadota bacterium]
MKKSILRIGAQSDDIILDAVGQGQSSRAMAGICLNPEAAIKRLNALAFIRTGPSTNTLPALWPW